MDGFYIFLFVSAYHDKYLISISFSASNKPMKLDLWCPIRSAVVFFSAFIAVKNPTFVPALFFYLIAAAMLSVSYQRSKNPSPWNRCQVRSLVVCIF